MAEPRVRFVGCLVGAAFLLTATGSRAAVIVVPDDHATIQAAVTAAAAGDTVQVRPGTYAEKVRIEGARSGLILEALGGRPTITPPSGEAFRVDEVGGVVIRGFDIAAASGGRGVRLDKSVGSTLDDLVVTGAKDGILVRRGSAVTVTGSSVTGAFLDGIRMDRSPGAVVTANTVNGSGRHGIMVKSCATATVAGNTVSNTVRDGLQVMRADTSTSVTGNTVSMSGRIGLRVKSCSNATVTGTASVGAGRDAIVMLRVTTGTFDGNTASGAAASGIQLRRAENVTVTNNVADANGEYGFWVRLSPPLDDVGDLTGAGNTATGNPAGDFRVDP